MFGEEEVPKFLTFLSRSRSLFLLVVLPAPFRSWDDSVCSQTSSNKCQRKLKLNDASDGASLELALLVRRIISVVDDDNVDDHHHIH